MQQGIIFILGLLTGGLIVKILSLRAQTVKPAGAPDLAEQERVEEEHSRLAAIVESSEDAIIGKTLDGIVTSWNGGAERIYGWRAEEIVGRSIAMILPPDQPDELARILERLKRGDRIDRFRTERICKDGRRIPVAVAISPIRDSRGRLIGAATISHDISERLEFESRLNEQAERLASANQQLADADRHKDEFLAILAHELRNPLAPIRYAVQTLSLTGSASPGLQKQREVIERQVTHMARLIDDLLDISRISSGKIRLKRELVDLRQVADRAIETLQGQLQERRHRLDYVRGSVPVLVEGDATRLEQVTRNLLTNAIKYTEPGGRITLSIELNRQDDTPQAAIRIKDNGIGISQEMLGRVFDLFTQAERSLDSSQGGLGIGLTLVRRLVKLHGGRVQALSDGPGQGSEFIMTLPGAGVVPLMAAGDAATAARVAALEAEKSTAGAGLVIAGPGVRVAAEVAEAMPLRVLVVDDDLDSATSLAELLTTWKHRVQVAYDGQSALCLALGNPPPELVLLDLGLPELDGYEVARHIRQDPKGHGMILAALTGFGQEDDRMRSQEAGFDDHYTKPIRMEALARLLARAAESRREAA